MQAFGETRCSPPDQHLLVRSRLSATTLLGEEPMKDTVGEARVLHLVRVVTHNVLRRVLTETRHQTRLVLRRLLFICFLIIGGLVLLHFPYDTDMFICFLIISGLVLLHFPYDTDPSWPGGQIAPTADAAPVSSGSNRTSGRFYEAAYGPDAT